MVNLQLASEAAYIPDKKLFELWVKTALNKHNTAEVTIRIVDEAEMQELNAKYRHQDKPTNVLAFPAELPPELGLPLLGDVVICAPIVNQEAKQQHKTLEEHWAHIVIHGVLHLLGYDHIDDAEADVMEQLEIKLLQQLGFDSPYDNHGVARRAKPDKSTRMWKWIQYLIAIAAGIQLPLAFAPYHLYILAFVSPTLLLALWLYATPKDAFKYGLLYGLSGFGFGVYWVYISIHTFGNAPIALAIFLTGILIVALSCFPALQGYLVTKFFPKNNLVKLLLVFPASWVLFEWGRIWVLSGFPWLFIGYTQLTTPLAHIAPILGIYGVSFATILTCGAILALFLCTIRRDASGDARSCVSTKLRVSTMTITIMILILLWGGSMLLGRIHWTHKQGQAIPVTLIQGNIPEQEKWDINNLPKILKMYQHLTQQNWHSKIIVWPEAAMPAFAWQIKPYLTSMAKLARQHHSTIITGVVTQNLDTKAYYNSMITLGATSSVYHKRHLVPFGEYLILAPISNWIVKFFKLPMSSFTPGKHIQPAFIADKLYIAPSICYEVAYPREILTYFPKAQLLINVTDDSWFGKSIAAAQQLQMAQMRSLETGRYQLISTNTGVSAIVNPDGSLQKRGPMFQQAVINGTVYAMTGNTPWVKLGQYLWLWLVLIVLVVVKLFWS